METNQNDGIQSANSGRIQISWNLREVFELVLKVNDALSDRGGKPIPLHPGEIADLLELQKFFNGSLSHAYRRCLCNKVYCRSPEKDKPCVIPPEQILEDKNIIYQCRWRGKRL